MCLGKVDWVLPKGERPSRAKRTGWKVFSDQLRPLFYRSTKHKVGVWARSKEGVRDYPTYERGFHIYKRKSGYIAYGEHRRLVEYHSAVAVGSEEGIPVVVARWMRVLPMSDPRQKTADK